MKRISPLSSFLFFIALLVLNASFVHAQAPCNAGMIAPDLNSNVLFTKETSIYKIKCGASTTTADLSTIICANIPAGMVLTWHSGYNASSANKISNVTKLVPGIYFAAFEKTEGANLCYSLSTGVNVLLQAPCNDVDKDGVPDVDDLDNDNDGILDTDEKSFFTIQDFESPIGTRLCTSSPVNPNVSNNIFKGDVFFNGNPKGWRVLNGENIQSVNIVRVNKTDHCVVGSNTAYSNNQYLDMVGDNTFVYDFALPFTAQVEFSGAFSKRGSSHFGVSFTGVVKIINTDNNQEVLSGNSVSITDPPAGSEAEWKVSKGSGTLPQGNYRYHLKLHNAGHVDYLMLRYSVDTDKDGIPDYLDTDSDNDGCPDAIEATGDFSLNDLDAANRLKGGVDERGVPVVAGPSGQKLSPNVTLAGKPSQITSQPQDANVKAGENAIFSTIVSNGSGTGIFQWQMSVDNGTTWVDIANGGVYSGVSTETLIITGVAASMNSYKFRLVIKQTDYVCPVVSSATTLSVTGAPPVPLVIDAVNDDMSSLPIKSNEGNSNVVNVLNNDKLNEALPTLALVNLTIGEIRKDGTVYTGNNVKINTDGTVNVAPNTPSGIYTLVYTICEKASPTNCDNATITLAVISQTSISITAKNDTVKTEPSKPITVRVLQNDILNGYTVKTTLSALPSNGTALVNADNTITYTPNGTYTGEDRFEYRICMANNICSTAIVYISINSEPVAPPIVIYNAITPNEDGTNDFLLIENITHYPINTVSIFNRWGDLIKIIVNYNNSSIKWDGTNHKNRKVPDGVYWCKLSVPNKKPLVKWVLVRSSLK